ncbi:hypothetical protein R1sor_012570 [Riccia sorocarpa]|uniref:Reverse transcriptase domain-containing protein n=1 Tax=Riccia sorocarpa TaxID=122646 RepID=A0ABD3IAD2_9MARC
MSLTYKVINKILAVRLRGLLPKLVEPQQTGFVMGRNITDNVLGLKLSQEWAQWTSQKALFVKLDFVKAYDRVDHRFLYRTLERLGFDRQFVQLIQGFAWAGSARVHVNGAFSTEIKVERGVRQGCPLAPLLFALCSQSFMLLLRRAESEGRLKGLQIEPGRSVLHQLFADDTGICIQEDEENFLELKRILAVYELASGAKINMNKIVIMPLGSSTVPEWVLQTGCEVATGDKMFKYLGVWSGVDVKEGECVKAAVRRMQSKMGQWENMYLPWTARAILIKHVLSQIPSYIMLSVGCDKAASGILEKICRDFFWGVTSEGKPRKPLIAWARLVRPKDQGGLGLMTFESRYRALQMRHVCDLLEEREVEWVPIARRVIQIKLRIGPSKCERSQWHWGDSLLLLNGWRVPEVPTLDRLLKVWFYFRKSLSLSDAAVEFPRDLPVASLQVVWKFLNINVEIDFVAFKKETRRCKVVTLRELWENLGGDGDAVHNREGRLICQVEEEISSWVRSIQVVDKCLLKVAGWQWEDKAMVVRTWRRPAKEWSLLQWGKTPVYRELSRWWGVQADSARWTWRWVKLWKCSVIPRKKIWLWRVLQQGLLTYDRLKKWGLEDGVCTLCGMEDESIEHMLWTCRRLRTRVEWVMTSLLNGQRRSLTLLQALDMALGQSRHPAAVMLISEHCWQSWKERNLWVFQGERKVLLSRQLLRVVQEEARIVLSWGLRIKTRKEAAGTTGSQFEAAVGLVRRSGGLATQPECEEDGQCSEISVWSSTTASSSEDRTSADESGVNV